jgi:2-desacetyl-2-hydroxyethyl bacteriochlorophyllide A dehydrogenase
MMKALVCIKPGCFEYREVNDIDWKPGFTLLKIKRVGVCGTDLHAFEGTQPYFNYPRILGHELAAEIIETDAAGFSKNETVTCIPYFNCGKCVACKKGKPNCCASIQVCGVHVDGALAEYFAVPSNLLLHANNLTPDELALVEPFSVGAHAVRRAAIGINDVALIVGAGPIGLATAEMARVAGAKIIIADTNENRLKFCAEHLSIQHIINPASDNMMEYLQTLTQGAMPDVVFDATGNLKAINNAFQYIAHAGKYVLVGLQKEEIKFSHPEFHKREATLMSSRNATKEDFLHVIDCMNKKQVNAARYITHRLKFDEVKNKFADLLNPANGVIKAMIEMS